MANKSYETLNRLYEELGAILSAANIPAAEDSADEENLDSMSYGDLKKLCKSRGLSAKGSREELIAALTDAADGGDDEDEPEEKPAKKRGGKKKSEPEPEPEEEDDEADDDDSDDIQSQVEAAVSDMSLEELAEFCEENGLSSKGKRQALISRIVKAVEKGDIELSDGEDEDDEEEEEEEEEPPKKSKKSGGKKSKKDEEPDEDEDSDDETEPTKERAAALKKYKKDTKAQFKNGEIERDELVEFLCDFHGEKKSAYKKMTDDEVLEAYIDASSNMIDDDGEIVEEGAYSVNGVPYCCGRPLNYDEESGQFVCEYCGGEYEADGDEE